MIFFFLEIVWDFPLYFNELFLTDSHTPIRSNRDIFIYVNVSVNTNTLKLPNICVDDNNCGDLEYDTSDWYGALVNVDILLHNHPSTYVFM